MLLAQGGEIAQEAYEDLGELAALSYIQGLGKETEKNVDIVKDVLNEALGKT
jgi:hypothetical protein